MRTFDLGEIIVFVLAAAGIVYGLAVAVIQIRRKARKPDPLQFHAGRRGATHIILGPGHTVDEDCACQPHVAGPHGQRFVEHRDLKAVR